MKYPVHRNRKNIRRVFCTVPATRVDASFNVWSEWFVLYRLLELTLSVMCEVSGLFCTSCSSWRLLQCVKWVVCTVPAARVDASFNVWSEWFVLYWLLEYTLSSMCKVSGLYCTDCSSWRLLQCVKWVVCTLENGFFVHNNFKHKYPL